MLQLHVFNRMNHPDVNPTSPAQLIRVGTLARVLAGLLALSGCARHAPQPADALPPAGVQQAWVQAVAGPAWAVRALTTEAACPALSWAGGNAAMQQRSAPGDEPPPPGNKESDRKDSHFTLRACEAPWPAGAAQVQLGGLTLQAPAAEPRRIVVIGDTGCRLKGSEAAYQACNDADDWPFAQVLAQALALKPDLVIHVGDYHYRESPCPVALPGCAHSPWGYGDDTWQADFFRPARALLASAPWVFVRGNHEACSRAGQGWLRYLDAEPGVRACETAPQGVNAGDFTVPFAVPLSTTRQFIVFDSSAIGTQTPPTGSPAWQRWRAQLDDVAALARGRESYFINHHPSLAYSPSLLGNAAPARSGLTPLLQASQPERYFAPGIVATLHGHLHLHEALGFASDHPATLVIGNGGSTGYGRVSASSALQAQVAPGTKLETFESHSDYGLSLLTATPTGWTLDALDRQGRQLAHCTLQGQRLRCPG